MEDLVFIGVGLGFFAVCVAYVRGLDRLVRSAADADATHDADLEEAPARQVAA